MSKIEKQLELTIEMLEICDATIKDYGILFKSFADRKDEVDQLFSQAKALQSRHYNARMALLLRDNPEARKSLDEMMDAILNELLTSSASESDPTQ